MDGGGSLSNHDWYNALRYHRVFSDIAHLVNGPEEIHVLRPSRVNEYTTTPPPPSTSARSLPRGHTDLLLPREEPMISRNGFPLPKTTGR